MQVIHVDRRNLCAAAQNGILTLYEDGFSAHGREYNRLISVYDEAMYASALIEHFFELIRRTEFPDMPSRFKCWFGSDPNAPPEQQWCNREGLKEYPVWLVEAEKTYTLDADLLSILAYDDLGSPCFSPDMMYMKARYYWQGKTLHDLRVDLGEIKHTQCSKQPGWEILLIPPIRVLQKVR